MNLLIHFEGEDAVGETADFKGWLQRERIAGLTAISQKEEPPGPGELGPTLLAILGLVLGAEATVELVRCIHRWIETRKRKITITIQRWDQTITVDCENPGDVGALVNSVAEISHG